MTKVSVILPVYGVADYIEACTKSLLAQTLEDVEFLFVDDHGPDNSIAILQRTIEGHPRASQFRVLTPEHNLGAGMARNFGIPEAHGEYISFIDPDDTLTVAHADEQGSVIALTDENAALLFRASYSPHGEDWGSSGTNATPFAWLGGLGVMRQHNSQLTTPNSKLTILYLTRHRLYSPVLRRFLSADPLGIAGGLNLYAYANGNPLAYIDPLGLCASDSDWGMRIGDFFEMIGNGLSTAGGNLARGVDGTWNLALELMASNPNFRNAGVQNAVYQAVVDEWGSPLKRLGAYGEEPIAVEPEIVDALWDLGAAATTYRNLGVRQEMKPIATREMPNLPVPGTTVLYHGGRLDNGAVQSRTFSTTTDYSYANEHARMRGGQVFRFNVPNRFINENALRKLDSIRGSPLSGEEYRFIGSNVNELNRYLQK